MPANLNALIRYKTINSCLFGGVRRWTIDELIDACTGALADARGRYGRVSERTIRDDIRVMRSDILGFNAPIKQEKGLYYYSDPHYSILSLSLTDAVLISKIVRLLLDIRESVKHPELEIILNKLVKITGEPLPEVFAREKVQRDETLESGIPMQSMVIRKYMYNPDFGSSDRKAKKISALFPEPEPENKPSSPLRTGAGPDVSWGDIMGLIRLQG